MTFEGPFHLKRLYDSFLCVLGLQGKKWNKSHAWIGRLFRVIIESMKTLEKCIIKPNFLGFVLIQKSGCELVGKRQWQIIPYLCLDLLRCNPWQKGDAASSKCSWYDSAYLDHSGLQKCPAWTGFIFKPLCLKRGVLSLHTSQSRSENTAHLCLCLHF